MQDRRNAGLGEVPGRRDQAQRNVALGSSSAVGGEALSSSALVITVPAPGGSVSGPGPLCPSAQPGALDRGRRTRSTPSPAPPARRPTPTQAGQPLGAGWVSVGKGRGGRHGPRPSPMDMNTAYTRKNKKFRERTADRRKEGDLLPSLAACPAVTDPSVHLAQETSRIAVNGPRNP